MDINLVAGTIPQPVPAAPSADPVIRKAAASAPPQPVAAQAAKPEKPDNSDQAEQKRYEAVLRASQNFFRDVYAVSDTTFTIYKDSSGQYITRYTSLRDGKVTYIPEPALLQYLHSSGRHSLVEIEA